MTHTETNQVVLYGKQQKFDKLFQSVQQHQQITESENKLIIENILNREYNVNLTTKYYDAHVKFHLYEEFSEQCLNEHIENTKAFNGFVVYVDDNAESLNETKLFLLNETIKNSIVQNEYYLKLVVIDSFDSLSTQAQSGLTELCDGLDFFLLKFNEEDDYVQEFINILHVHEWLLTSVKNNKIASHRATDSLVVDETATASMLTSAKLDAKPENKESSSNLYADNTDSGKNEEELEKIFMNLKDMRDKASNLSTDERRLYAENVVKQFWSAMGGDEEELFGLDSDED